MFHEIIVLGGGASGITAAIASSDMGKDVAILEGTQRIGNKILTTGNGRCNVTNEHICNDRYHSDNKNFFNHVLNSFNLKDTINFFNSIGISLVTLEQNKMYPMSLQASSVLDLLRLALEDRNIPIYTNTKATEVLNENGLFKIITATGEIYECKKLILCCGGKSAPNTGSDGSGFKISKSLNHNIITPLPALVQLKLNYSNLKALSGVKFNGYVDILVNNKCIRSEFGEILFTDYGISGPPILQLSRTASVELNKSNNVTLKINMMPDNTKEQVIEFLENHWGMFSYRSVVNSFIGIVNKKMIPIILKEASIDNIHKPCYDLTWQEKQAIFNILTEWTFSVSDTNSFKNAQVTVGGVDTKNINKETLESLIVNNLYFAGEILDVDGDCGGFNLQWAWSSGFVAGKSAADI